MLVIPEVVVEERTAVLSGLDGRKMSKSYNNTIPLFETEKKLRKSIMKIKTNSLEPGEPKDPDDSVVFEIYRAFCNDEEAAAMRDDFAGGISWGDSKQRLFEKINETLAEPRDKYLELMQNTSSIEDILEEGARKARIESRALMDQLRAATGISAKG